MGKPQTGLFPLWYASGIALRKAAAVFHVASCPINLRKHHTFVS